MATDLEQKMLMYGDNNLRLIRVIESSGKSRFVANILISVRHIKDGSQEMFSVLIQPLTATAAILRKEADRLSINKFEASVNHMDRTINLGPLNGVQIEESLRDRGIGTYALNELIVALRNCCPNYTFNPYEITLPAETTPEVRERLLTFLSKFNIAMGFSDIEQRVGTIRAGQPQQLISHYNVEKIQEMNLEEFIFQMVGERYKNDNEITNLKTEISRMGEETFSGIPKKQLVKYTLIGCCVTLLVIFLLIWR